MAARGTPPGEDQRTAMLALQSAFGTQVKRAVALAMCHRKAPAFLDSTLSFRLEAARARGWQVRTEPSMAVSAVRVVLQGVQFGGLPPLPEPSQASPRSTGRVHLAVLAVFAPLPASSGRDSMALRQVVVLRSQGEGEGEAAAMDAAAVTAVVSRADLWARSLELRLAVVVLPRHEPPVVGGCEAGSSAPAGPSPEHVGPFVRALRSELWRALPPSSGSAAGDFGQEALLADNPGVRQAASFATSQPVALSAEAWAGMLASAAEAASGVAVEAADSMTVRVGQGSPRVGIRGPAWESSLAQCSASSPPGSPLQGGAVRVAAAVVDVAVPPRLNKEALALHAVHGRDAYGIPRRRDGIRCGVPFRLPAPAPTEDARCVWTLRAGQHERRQIVLGWSCGLCGASVASCAGLEAHSKAWHDDVTIKCRRLDAADVSPELRAPTTDTVLYHVLVTPEPARPAEPAALSAAGHRGPALPVASPRARLPPKNLRQRQRGRRDEEDDEDEDDDSQDGSGDSVDEQGGSAAAEAAGPAARSGEEPGEASRAASSPSRGRGGARAGGPASRSARRSLAARAPPKRDQGGTNIYDSPSHSGDAEEDDAKLPASREAAPASPAGRRRANLAKAADRPSPGPSALGRRVTRGAATSGSRPRDGEGMRHPASAQELFAALKHTSMARVPGFRQHGQPCDSAPATTRGFVWHAREAGAGARAARSRAVARRVSRRIAEAQSRCDAFTGADIAALHGALDEANDEEEDESGDSAGPKLAGAVVEPVAASGIAGAAAPSATSLAAAGLVLSAACGASAAVLLPLADCAEPVRVHNHHPLLAWLTAPADLAARLPSGNSGSEAPAGAAPTASPTASVCSVAPTASRATLRPSAGVSAAVAAPARAHLSPLSAAAAAAAAAAGPGAQLVRPYFRSRSNAPIAPGEADDDSDDDVSDTWALHRARSAIARFGDVQSAEREFMMLWCGFVARFRLLSMGAAQRGVAAFARAHGVTILRRRLRGCFLLHLLTMWDQGWLESPAVSAAMQIVDSYEATARRLARMAQDWAAPVQEPQAKRRPTDPALAHGEID